MTTEQENLDKRNQIYQKLRDDLFKRELSNAESYDKAILTYSSAGLALSLGFLKNIGPVKLAVIPCTLYMSWGFFISSITMTILSFLLSQWGIRVQLRNAECYYLECDESAYKRKNLPALWTDVANISAGLSFIIAIILTTVFISLNLSRG